MKQYILDKSTYRIIATYSKSGKLKKLDAKRGFLIDAVKAGYTFSYLEESIDLEHWKPHLLEKDAFFTPALKAWMEFYYSKAGLSYRFTGTDGKALKEIGKHLTSLAADSNEAIEMWKFILKNWHTLDPFYSHKMQLTFVNAQLNTILNLIRNGKQTSNTTARSDADDIRQRFQS